MLVLHKYLKYKNKYLSLQKQMRGGAAAHSKDLTDTKKNEEQIKLRKKSIAEIHKYLDALHDAQTLKDKLKNQLKDEMDSIEIELPLEALEYSELDSNILSFLADYELYYSEKFWGMYINRFADGISRYREYIRDLNPRLYLKSYDTNTRTLKATRFDTNPKGDITETDVEYIITGFDVNLYKNIIALQICGPETNPMDYKNNYFLYLDIPDLFHTPNPVELDYKRKQTIEIALQKNIPKMKMVVMRC
jgi:hypothetical protein